MVDVFAGKNRQYSITKNLTKFSVFLGFFRLLKLIDIPSKRDK